MACDIPARLCLFMLSSTVGVRLITERFETGSCPAGQTDPVVAQIQDAAAAYESQMDTRSIIAADSKWFTGNPPELVDNWKDYTMQAKFGSAMDPIRVKGTKEARKLVSQIWENPDDSRGTEAMWNGKFWGERGGGFQGWSSQFSTAHDGDEAQTVTATSVPFLGVDRVNASAGATFYTHAPVVCGEGHGAISTAVRKGWCGGKKSKGVFKTAWKVLTRAPANVFLTTYKSSSSGINHRKQVRSGSLAYNLEGSSSLEYKFTKGDSSLITKAAATLANIVQYALTQPAEKPTTKPRVRFTQLMAHYVTRVAHDESKFIEDQVAVVERFKEMLANEDTQIAYEISSSDFVRLLPDDVVQLRYSTNGWGLDKFGHEDKDKTRRVNLPAFFTYLRWIAEDLGELMKENDLSIGFGLHGERVIRSGMLRRDRENAWSAYCVESEPIWTSLPVGSLLKPDWLLSGGIFATVIGSHLDGSDKLGSRTKHLQCWNRNLRHYTDYLVQENVPLAKDSEESRKVQRLQVALDLLYQLQSQRKSTDAADKLACGGTCAPAHRTAELLQIAVLDTMLGVLTFSNCKSGLDRTGIYHALQSAVDQLHILYPQCTLDLAFIAVHFTKLVELSISAMNSEVNASHTTRLATWVKAREGREADLQCNQDRHNPLVWEEPTSPDVGSVHMFDIMRNAVLKNLIEVGIKITFSSTGMAGVKYAGYTAEYAAQKCRDLRKSKKDASCDNIGAELVLGTKDEANPMIAPFLPNWVSFGSAPNEKVMPLLRLHDNELYIASDLVDTSESGLQKPMTGCALVQDAAHLRGS